MNFHGMNKKKVVSSEYYDNKSKLTPIAMVAPEVKQSMDLKRKINKTCAVNGCEDYKNLEEEAFFRFPEDPSLRQIWTDLTGRNNWTPTDYSYICFEHFSIDSFEPDTLELNSKAIPSLKLPGNVFEIEYIDEETLDNEEPDYDFDMEEDHIASEYYEEEQKPPQTYFNHMNGQDETIKEGLHDIAHKLDKASIGRKDSLINQKYDKTLVVHKDSLMVRKVEKPSVGHNQMENDELESKKNDLLTFMEPSNDPQGPTKITTKANTEKNGIEILKLFTTVQKMQRQVIGLRDKLRSNIKMRARQKKSHQRLQEIIEIKKRALELKRKKKSRILLTIQDKMKEDQEGLVMAMPTKLTDDLKNFALSIYKYSPQAYIYIRNTLRTMLPATETLETWISAGFQPKNILMNNSLIKVVAEQTDKELTCKVILD